ncbi:GNAT family N-acetyltransferase [Nocardia amikacinitolerans]|uniref:GNAT family N-acetyltransferase n=1 Tax=Nocardia amikacinitolerans TaxID=756689 RepID=UPI00368A5DBE
MNRHGFGTESPDEFDPVCRGIFVVAYLAGSPIACGGYRKHLDDSTGRTAEIKRMYVEPELRRSGIARELLTELESKARADGYRAAILDCGSKQSNQPHIACMRAADTTGQPASQSTKTSRETVPKARLTQRVQGSMKRRGRVAEPS